MADDNFYPIDQSTATEADSGWNDAALLSQLAYAPNSAGFVVQGLGFSVDFAASPPLLTVETGWARLHAPQGQTLDHSNADPAGPPPKTVLDQVLPIQMAQRSGLELVLDSPNWVYLTGDRSVADSGSYVIENAESPPDGPSLLLGTVDTTAATADEAIEELNRESPLAVHVGDMGNPHGVTAQQATAIPAEPGSVPENFLAFAVATQTGLDAVDAAKVETSTRDLQPEGAQTGLAADATGVVYEGVTRQLLDDAIVNADRSVVLEAATTSSAGDEAVTVELYDDDAAAVVGSIELAGGSPRTRSDDFSDGLTAGTEVHVQWNVTTPSATADATFDATAARLIID